MEVLEARGIGFRSLTEAIREEAAAPNDVWAMDFVHDQLALGRKLRILTVVDTHSRFCPAGGPALGSRAHTRRLPS